MSAAVDFLELMLPPTGSNSVLVAIHPDTGEIEAHSIGRDCGSFITAADDWIEGHRGWNHYFSVNPTKTSLDKKPTKNDIAAMHWVHLDCDDPSEAAAARIRSYAVPPTVLVFSGGGYQAFWKLREPIPVNGNIEQLEALNKRVLLWCGGRRVRGYASCHAPCRSSPPQLSRLLAAPRTSRPDVGRRNPRMASVAS